MKNMRFLKKYKKPTENQRSLLRKTSIFLRKWNNSSRNKRISQWKQTKSDESGHQW